MAAMVFATIAIYLAIFRVVSGCVPTNWRHFPMEEILFKADIVVYGMETERVADPSGFQNAKFQVFCIFKSPGPDPIPQNITIEEVYPQTSCSGTFVDIGESVILALKRATNGNFKWHEVNVTPDSANFVPTKDNLARTVRVCGLQSPMLPAGRLASQKPTCPQVSQTDEMCTIGAKNTTIMTTIGPVDSSPCHQFSWVIWAATIVVVLLDLF